MTRNGSLCYVSRILPALLRRAKPGNPLILTAFVAALAGLCLPRAAQAQCYAFESGSAASLILNITNLPTPTNVSEGSNGQTLYTYTLTGLSGNSVTLTVGGTAYTSTSPNPFTITVFQYPGTATVVTVNADLGSAQAAISLGNTGADLLPGGLTPVLPVVSSWPNGASLIVNGTTTYLLTAITNSCSPPTSGKALGDCAACNSAGMPSTPGMPGVGMPITIGTGNMFESKEDYTTAGPNPLYFTRYYNSQASYNSTFAGTMGNWRTPFDRYLHISPASSPTTVIAERADGQMLTFTGSGSSWSTDTDVDYTLTLSGTTWTLTDPNDTVETYNDNSAGEGVLSTIKLRDGYTQTMTYSSGLLSSVADSYSRSLGLTYTSGLLTKVTNPDSTSTGIVYAYNSNGALSTVTYPTSTATTLTYLYENTSLPLSLTGITDQNGNRYATWGYDSAGHATSNYMGGSSLNANSITISYSSSTPTVTNAFGVVDTYTFSTLQGVPKVTEIDRASTSTTAAAHRYFTYDTNGCLATSKDWNGNETSYSNNSHCLPSGSSAIVEASGSSVSRTTGITYDTTCIHLPAAVTKTGVTITFTYSSCNLHTRTETDTTSGSTPYSTNGTARTWTWTYTGTGQPTSVTGPRTDLTQETQWAYTGGVLTSFTDAASHTTTINTYTSGGQPTKTTDPNGVVRTYTYDFIDGGQQKMLTYTVDTSGGNYTTTYGHDSAGNLTQVKIPDGTHSDYVIDNAHRVTKFTNANGEYISYTLDQLGGRTEEDIYNSSSTRTRKHTRTFTALGQLLTDVGWPTTSTSLTTTYAYDAQGNVTSIQDRRGNTTSYSYDALNRQYQVTDRLSHTTTTVYDTNDNVTKVTDPNSNATNYTRMGFGFPIQIVNPDSGTSVYHIDLAGNVTKKVDGASVETDYTYDALNRETARTFPADSTRNISKTYDQTGGTFGYGFGIGHLTSMTDNAGTLHQQFEERGNVVHHQRLNGLSQIDTYAAFDKNNRQWEFVYPNQWMLLLYRDNAGQMTEIDSIQQSGSWVYTGGVPVVSSVTHFPFGPVSGLSFHNGLTKTVSVDLDYRTTEIKDAATSSVIDLQYAYDGNGNPTITDNVNAANSMTTTGTGQGYDKDDRFLGASSGTGGYGTLTYTYDSNSNRSTETRNGTTDTYTYNSGTNQIHGFNDSSNTNYVYNGAGEITQQHYGSYDDLHFVDDVTEQLYTPIYQGYGLPSYYAAYNGFGQRETKQSNVFWNYSYDFDGRVAQEWNTVGRLADYVYLDGQLVALNEMTNYGMSSTTEATYYVHADRLGTPQAVTDGSKTVQWKTLYEPFGFPASSSNPGNIVQDVVFPGQVNDNETGIPYNGSRYYNPLTGSYVQTDFADILQSRTTNTYTYAASNPFRFIDENGLASHVNELGPSNSPTLTTWASSYQPPDYNTIAVHGTDNPYGDHPFATGNGPFGPFISPQQLADDLTNAPGYDPNLPIRLVACGSVSTGGAQAFANAIGRPIWASPVNITYPVDPLTGLPIPGAEPVTSGTGQPVPWQLVRPNK